MIIEHNTRNALCYTVATDEKWFHAKPSGNTAARKCWVSPEEDMKRQAVARRTQSSAKVREIMAVTFSHIFHFKSLALGITVNSNEYLNF